MLVNAVTVLQESFVNLQSVNIGTLLRDAVHFAKCTIQQLDWDFVGREVSFFLASRSIELLEVQQEWLLFLKTSITREEFRQLALGFVYVWLNETPNKVNSLLMSRVFGSICQFAVCCARGFSKYDPDDEIFYSSPDDQHSETETLIRTSLKDRIEKYEKAMTESERPLQGSKPTPYKRPHSASDVIGQFETLAMESGQPSPRRQILNEYHKRQTENPRNTAIKIQSNTALPKCAVCVKPMYPTDSTIESFGRKMHAGCFSCRLCEAKLTHHPLEVQFDLPASPDDNNKENDEQHGGVLYCICAKCQQASILEGKSKTVATLAGERVLVGDEELGDVDGVKEAIGDELEEILLEKTVPRCQVCGADFLNYGGDICILGQVKYHQECWESGRPVAVNAENERPLTPAQAAKYLSDRWILRIVTKPLSLQDSSETVKRSKIVATLFFVWNNRISDLQDLSASQRKDSPVSLNFDLDEKAMGNPNYVDSSKRKVAARLPSLDVEEIVLEMELLGNPMSSRLVGSPLVINADEPFLSLVLEGTKYQVKHSLHLHLPFSEDSAGIDLSRAQLTIDLGKQNE